MPFVLSWMSFTRWFTAIRIEIQRQLNDISERTQMTLSFVKMCQSRHDSRESQTFELQFQKSLVRFAVRNQSDCMNQSNSPNPMPFCLRSFHTKHQQDTFTQMTVTCWMTNDESSIQFVHYVIPQTLIWQLDWIPTESRNTLTNIIAPIWWFIHSTSSQPVNPLRRQSYSSFSFMGMVKPTPLIWKSNSNASQNKKKKKETKAQTK